jgi:hypothetical protein
MGPTARKVFAGMALLGTISCSTQDVELWMLDGLDPHSNTRESVPQTTFFVSAADVTGTDGQYSIRMDLPDEFVGDLPLAVHDPQGECSWFSVYHWTQETFRGERLTVLAPTHDGLIVEMTGHCGEHRFRIVGAFRVAGPRRKGVWPYLATAPRRTILDEIGETIEIAVDGAN